MSKHHNCKGHISGAPQKVRIIGGSLKGRLLPVIQKTGLRPTSNRIRETVFNWLQAYIEGSECLDLFAGSGALGFEAASRGASHVTLIDNDADVVKLLTEQAELLQVNNVEVMQANSLGYPQMSEKSYDIVFIDPPFNQIKLQDMLVGNALLPIIKASTKIYVESPLGQLPEALPVNWSWWRRAKASQVEYGLIATS